MRFPSVGTGVGHVSVRREAVDGVTLEVQQRAWPVDRRNPRVDGGSSVPGHGFVGRGYVERDGRREECALRRSFAAAAATLLKWGDAGINRPTRCKRHHRRQGGTNRSGLLASRRDPWSSTPHRGGKLDGLRHHRCGRPGRSRRAPHRCAPLARALERHASALRVPNAAPTDTQLAPAKSSSGTKPASATAADIWRGPAGV